jgi:phosphatidylserine/phosphatidylglycerophosphate/cardiolipin synthase-like enzyme
MIHASLFSNGDDCFLVWGMPRTPDCRGFAIARENTTAQGKHYSGYIHNRTGFQDERNEPHEHRPSSEWPFQRYTWTDHQVGEGDRVSYSIAPVLERPTGLEVDKTSAAALGPIEVSSRGAGKVEAFFNRGIWLSQFMAKQLGDHFTTGDLVKLKNRLADDDTGLRRFLMGPLGEELLSLLRTAKTENWHVYAALYELDDPALVAALKELGGRAHVVLSNGSSKKKNSDGNQAAAAALAGSVDLTRRMLWSEGLAHNKFVVFADSPTDPRQVWTGSTNWATTALCTQLNNALRIEDGEIARVYLEQWHLLKNDKRTGRGGSAMHFGPALVDSNNQPKDGADDQTGKWTIWFTRTGSSQDMQALSTLINQAQHGILFLMFEPGKDGLLQVIQNRLSPASKTYAANLYVHGVVNTLQPTRDGQQVQVDLMGRGNNRPFTLKVVQPEGIKGGIGAWAAEVTRRDFLLGQGGVIGHAIIHSKMIVIDPFTNPVVITGSHNFSQSASAKNDENLVIVQGNHALAERYAVNIMAAYQHYRWRAYLQQCAARGVRPWQGLKRNDNWQKADATTDPELAFWLNSDGHKSTAVTP